MSIRPGSMMKKVKSGPYKVSHPKFRTAVAYLLECEHVSVVPFSGTTQTTSGCLVCGQERRTQVLANKRAALSKSAGMVTMSPGDLSRLIDARVRAQLEQLTGVPAISDKPPSGL